MKRPQGEWYYNYQNGWHCSLCNNTVKDMPTVMGEANFAFCPNCGAKMKKNKADCMKEDYGYAIPVDNNGCTPV